MSVLCLLYKDGNMERKVTWRTKGFKKYKNGSKGKNPGQEEKKIPLGACQVEVSATDRSLVQRSPTDCVCVIECDQVQ
jgi:hypothetical protein